MDVTLPWQQRVGEHRLQYRTLTVAFKAQACAGECPRQARHRTHRTGRNRVNRGEFRTGVDTHLICLFMPCTVFIARTIACRGGTDPHRAGQQCLRREVAARHFQPSQAIALRIM